MSETFLTNLFKDLADKLESKLAHDEASDNDATPPRINDSQLAADIGEVSPVATFIRNTRMACDSLLKPTVVSGPSPAAKDLDSKDAQQDVDAEFLDALQYRISKVRGSMTRPKETEIAKRLQTDKRFRGLAIADDFLRITQLKNIDSAMELVINQRAWQSSAQRVMDKITDVNAVSAQNPEEQDWATLTTELTKNISSGVSACSLIYSYWLDECGLHFALERIADRVENGVVSTTEALKMLHVSDSSAIVENASSFIISWQRGELFDVDARRKQYHALYGFPLHVARAWGSISTADSRASFVGAFHGLLCEASRYYESQRDLQKLPDIEAARGAIGQLLDALREGNENMRVRRTSQIRGQSEYCKRLLGGSVQGTPVALQWEKHLTGRPGITEAPDAKPWQVKVDAVASAFGWDRPRAKEYTALAESGETLLVMIRIGGEAATGSDEGVTKAFLALIQPYVQRYVNAFKVVGGVDLGRTLIAAPPAIIMARKIRHPAIPPLKRNWAARTPKASRVSAA
jgi:hypothetical protein